jgi:hypothetical protein
MYHIVKRVTKGGLISIDTTPHGRHGDGARYVFAAAGEGDDQYQLETETARQIMSDPGIAHHFEVDPPLPEPETERTERTAEPGTVDAADEQQFLTHKEAAEGQVTGESDLDGASDVENEEQAGRDTSAARRRARRP